MAIEMKKNGKEDQRKIIGDGAKKKAERILGDKLLVCEMFDDW
ncbi:MAG: hypothetical protein ABIG96_06190 [Candidatus Micrarchaeota archaeon]